MSAGGSQVLANALGRIARYSFGIGIAATAAQSSIYVVNGGQRAVIFNRITGIEDKVRGEVRFHSLCIGIAAANSNPYGNNNTDLSSFMFVRNPIAWENCAKFRHHHNHQHQNVRVCM